MRADPLQHVTQIGERIPPTFLHVMHKLISVAAVLPPASLPANTQFFRPSATNFIPRSLALLSIDSQPASVYRSSACQ